MSRLEKARNTKYAERRKAGKLVIPIIALVVLLIGGLLYFQDQLNLPGRNKSADIIDLERSVAFIDMFDLTYVWIFLHEEKEAESVTADGLGLTYNADRARWELVTSGYEDGDQLNISVVENDSTGHVQDLLLTVNDL